MLHKIFSTFSIGVILTFLVGLFIIGPIVTIWAINHLFGTTITITFWNWLSVLWLHLLVTNTSTKS
jgi:hypothetical protein